MMMRNPGSYIGYKPVGTGANGSIDGIFNMRQQLQSQRASEWPYSVAASLSLSYLNSATGSSVSTFTESNATLGVADTSRYIILAIGSVDGSFHTHDSVTVDGNSATQIVTAAAVGSGGADIRYSYWGVNVQTGTQGDIVVSISTNVQGVGVSWYRVLGLSSLVAIDTDVDTGTGFLSNPTTLSTIVPSDGDYISLSGVIFNNSSTTATIADAIHTRNYTADLNSNEHYCSASGANTFSAGTVDTDWGITDTNVDGYVFLSCLLQ